MVTSTLERAKSALHRHGELALAGGVVLFLVLLLLPVPPVLLDALLGLSLAGSIGVLVAVVLSRGYRDLVGFPALLLVLVLARLGLCVAVMRAALAHGEAGALVAGIGDTLTAGGYLAGVLIVLVLALVHILVVTAGAQRMAEVSARFALDALPGRQSALESAGLDAPRYREEQAALQEEIDFHASLEGAIRFVRGDGLATLGIALATFIGVALGPYADLGQAGQLVLGQGFLTLLPALVTAAAAALAIARAGRTDDATGELLRPFVGRPRAMVFAALAALAIALVPGTPKLALLFIAALCVALAEVARRGRPDERTSTGDAAADTAPEPEYVELAIGYSLLPLLAEGEGLLAQVRRARLAVAEEIGVSLPAVRIHDDGALKVSEYAVRFRGRCLTRARLMPSRVFALPPAEEDSVALSRAHDARSAVWDQMAGLWTELEQARRDGWTTLTPAEVLVLHVAVTLRRHASTFLGRQQAQEILDGLRATHPALVADLERKAADAGAVRAVGKALLAQGLSLADAPSILEALADEWPTEAPPAEIAARVRQAAPQMVTAAAQSADGVVHALTIAPHVAEALAGEAADDELPIPRLSAEDHAQLTRELVARVAQQTVRGRTPVVVCRDDIRELVEELARSAALGLLVVGWGELSPDARFVQVAQLGETLEPAPASREGPE